MSTFIALLRAVNLGGDTTVKMADFRELLSGLGFRSPRTLLQSGNAIFEASSASARTVAERIQAGFVERFGRPTEVLVRTAEEWRGILDRNPFGREAREDPSHLLVATLRDAPGRDAWQSLRVAVVGRERIEGSGREAYLYYPDGVGRSKLTAAMIEKHLRTRGTSRNWNTVVRIDAAARGAPGRDATAGAVEP